MTTIWLGVGLALAGIVMIGPLSWAMAIAALTLPMAATMVFAMGADPITLPVLTTLAFCLRHATTLVTKPQREIFLGLIAREWPLVALVGYALVSGMLFPRLFAGMTVVPAQDMARDGFAILGPHLVSVPQMGYFLVGGYFYIALRQSITRVGPMPLVVGGVIQTLAFGGMGFMQAILGLVGVEFPVDWLVTNTHYALLANVEAAGFVRVTAGFVEASSWAGWAAGPLAFCYALFINRVAALPALLAGAALAAAMLLSTSSSAYAGLFVLSVIAVAHVLIDPSPARRSRGLMVLAAGAGVFGAAAGLILAADPGQGFLGDLRMMLEEMTIRKQYSLSAIERGKMAQVGFQAGLDTFGLGAGFGTVRASGIIATLFGAVGLPGLILFAVFVAMAARILIVRPRTRQDAIRFAAGFAFMSALGPLVVSGVGLDLTNMIWVYAAIARTHWTPNAEAARGTAPSIPPSDSAPAEAGA